MTTTWHAVTTHEASRNGEPPEVYATEREAEARGRRLIASGHKDVVVWAIDIKEQA